MATGALDTRVLYVDIDGTLVGPYGDLFLTGEHEFTSEAADAIVEARRAGLELVPLSGRNVQAMANLARLIGSPAWIAELGAVRSYDHGNEVIFDTGAYEGGRALIEVLREAMHLLIAANPGRVEEHAPWNEHRETSLMVRGALDEASANAWLEDQGYEWAECIDNGVLPRTYESMPDVDTVRVFHLNPRGVTKRSGVAADLAHRGLTAADCAVIGDSKADLECAHVVGQAFIVANAIEKDPDLAPLVDATPNAEVTQRGHGQGFADVVARLIEG